MPADSQHRIHRHPAAPWAELRVSVDTLACYRAHSHDEYSIGVVDQGSATFHHPSGPHAVRAGTAILIEPTVVHSCNPSSRQRWSYRMLFVDATWLHGAVAQIWNLPTPPEHLEFLSRCVDDAAVVQRVSSFCDPLASDAAANALALELPAWLATWARSGRAQDAEPLPAELAPALETLHAQLERKITVGELAARCNMPASQFIRRFQVVLHMTPGRYLQNLRINGARRLLSQGMSLAEAAHTMGFADQAHLQRTFKAHHAMTPGSYRLRP